MAVLNQMTLSTRSTCRLPSSQVLRWSSNACRLCKWWVPFRNLRWFKVILWIVWKPSPIFRLFMMIYLLKMMTHCPYGDVKLPDAKGNHPKSFFFRLVNYLNSRKNAKNVGFMVTLWAALCCPVLLIFRRWKSLLPTDHHIYIYVISDIFGSPSKQVRPLMVFL